MKLNNFFKLIIAVGVSELAGVVGSLFTVSSISSWYAGLVKPALTPPAWVFGPVWILLYALMGVAFFFIWKEHSNIVALPVRSFERRRDNVGMLRKWKIGITLFFFQLVLNALWSIIFFGLQNPGAALIEIVFLWLAILATIVAFYKISRPAAYLLLPYILWVSFATYLNFAIWILNRPSLL